MNFAPILTSFKSAWAGSGSTALLPADNVWFGRAAQPAGYDGFPYLELFLSVASQEVACGQTDGTDLTTYNLAVNVYTVQGQTGGSTTGDPVTDSYNIQAAIDAMLRAIPPNQAWEDLPGFLHCLPTATGVVDEDELLFDGRDVYIYANNWHLLVGE